MYKICMPINTSRETQPHALCVLSYIRRSRIIIALYKRLIEWHHPIYSIPSNVSDFKFWMRGSNYSIYIHIALTFSYCIFILFSFLSAAVSRVSQPEHLYQLWCHSTSNGMANHFRQVLPSFSLNRK